MRSLAVVVVLVLGSGCGGSGTIDTPAQETAVTTAPAVTAATLTSSSEPSIASASATAPESPATEPDPTTVVDVTEATPWAIVLADPTGPRLRDWATSATRRPPDADAPNGTDAALAWIYADLIELWRDDVRLHALPMSDVALATSHREVLPGVAIDIVGSAAALLADSYAIIAGRASAAAVPGAPGEPIFTAWSAYAARMVDAIEHLRSTFADAQSLPVEDQVCFLAVFDGDDGCDGAGADLAAALLADAETYAQAIDDVEIEDLGTYRAFGVELDECAAWDRAASTMGLTDDEESRIWLAIDDHDLDVTFVARSECHWERERSEDAVADEVADRSSFRDYLEAVAVAIVETGYDEVSADFGNGAEDERREYEYRAASATTLVVDAARDVASRTWALVDDPVLATTLYEVADLEFDDWAELGMYELAWDEVTVCDAWSEVLGASQAELPDKAASAFDVAVSELGITGSLVPDHCD